jgi:histidine triad (HIT) family protein
VTDCVFCDYEGPSRVLWSNASAYVIEPLYAVAEGHVLVIPFEHAEDFSADPHVAAEAMRAASLYIREGDREGDWNLITSKGEAATQTVPHLHLHLLPRSRGDRLRLPWG